MSRFNVDIQEPAITVTQSQHESAKLMAHVSVVKPNTCSGSEEQPAFGLTCRFRFVF